MPTLAYTTLCHKPVLGIALWLASMCTEPPLMPAQPLPLAVAGAQVEQPIKVPVARKFQLWLRFEFATASARLADEIVGSGYTSDCDRAREEVPEAGRAALGRAIALRVVIRDARTNQITHDQTFLTQCSSAHSERGISRKIGLLDLVPGRYVIQVINLEPQAGLSGIVTTVMLQG